MRVDFPIPGSPPTKSAEPGTKPPPHTRSNSVMPVMRRGGGASSVLRSSSANLRPFTRLVALPPMGGAAPSSVMVFQPPQASHLPDHLGAVAPQDWQTKLVWDLAMMLFSVARPDGKPVRCFAAPTFPGRCPQFNTEVKSGRQRQISSIRAKLWTWLALQNPARRPWVFGPIPVGR